MLSSIRSRGGMICAATVLLLGLAACTNGRFTSNPILDIGLDYVGLGEKPEPAPEPAPSVGPPLIVGYNAIRVAIPGVGLRGQSQYFVAPDGVEIAMNNGFLTRAIGLGIDLQGMFLPVESPYFDGFVDAARNRSASERVAEYFLKGRITRDSYRCSLSISDNGSGKEQIDERCERYFDDGGFTNKYWVEDGEVVCSLQWFHPEGGFLQFFSTEVQATTLDLRSQGC